MSASKFVSALCTLFAQRRAGSGANGESPGHSGTDSVTHGDGALNFLPPSSSNTKLDNTRRLLATDKQPRTLLDLSRTQNASTLTHLQFTLKTFSTQR